jgi:hypothetical protein
MDQARRILRVCFLRMLLMVMLVLLLFATSLYSFFKRAQCRLRTHIGSWVV